MAKQLFHVAIIVTQLRRLFKHPIVCLKSIIIDNHGILNTWIFSFLSFKYSVTIIKTAKYQSIYFLFFL